MCLGWDHSECGFAFGYARMRDAAEFDISKEALELW